MSLQKKIYRELPEGIPGHVASNEPVKYAGNRIAGPGVKVGGFVFASAVDTNQDFVTGASPADGVPPLGIVEFQQIYPQTDFLSPGSLEVPQRQNVSVAVTGDFWIRLAAGSAPALHDYVFAVTADGSAKTAATPDAVVAGAVATHWRVSRIGQDGLVVVSAPNTGQYVAPPVDIS